MPKRKVSRNAACPCDSGKKYKDCCFTKRFEWHVDEKENFYRSVPMHPEVEAVLREKEKHFIRMFGRKPKADDPVFFDMPSSREIEELTVEAMFNANIWGGPGF